MFEENLIQEAGLTEGEAKVYLALLELGSSTVGPIITRSKVARSFAYNILNNLIQKGLVSYVMRDKTKHYQAAEPTRILEYLDKEREKIDKNKQEIEKLVPRLKLLQKSTPRTEINMYEGYKGIMTAFEHYEDKLSKGDEYICFGGYPTQKELFHNYWKKHHLERIKKGVKVKMLFDKEVSKEIMKNRNNYKDCDTRYLYEKLKMPAWFFIYKDTTTIILQENPDFQNTKSLAVEIVNQEITDTFKAIFKDYWAKTKPFKTK